MIFFFCFGPWALLTPAGHIQLCVSSPSGLLQGRNSAQIWVDNTWHELLLVKELASQGAIHSPHFMEVAAYRLFNLLVGSEELQPKQKTVDEAEEHI